MKHSKILISTLMVLWVSTILIFSFIVLGACEQPESSDGKIDLGTRIPETFSYTELTGFVGGEATSSVPTWTGVPPTDISYSITERPASATAEHVTIESSTGGITITTGAISLDSGDYTVTATVGDNDQTYTKDSTQTATIKVTVNTRIPETFSYAELTGFVGVEATSSVPTWTGVIPTDISYSITERPASATAEHVTIESSTGGITITTETTSLDSGDYTVTATVGDNDPVYTKDSIQTATIKVTVNTRIPETFSYAELTETAGIAVTSSAPTWTGVAPTAISYSITERPASATAEHVTIESSTGVVTITTGATSLDSGDYTVTATVGDNDPVYTKDSAQTATIKVTVNKADLNTATFSYAELTGFVGNEVSPVWTGTTPTDVFYSIVTSPAGAAADYVIVEPSTGVITIAAGATSADNSDYTVTATVGDNDPVYTKASTQTATTTVTVYTPISATFSYDDLTEFAGVAATSSVPRWTGTAPTAISYSIKTRPAEATAEHVTIESSTGMVTITTSTTSLDSGDYTVIATVGDNDPAYTKDSAQTATITVTVNKADLNTVTFSYDELTGTAGVETKSPAPTWTGMAPTDVSYSLRGLGGHIIIDSSTGVITITTDAIRGESDSNYGVTATVGGSDPSYTQDSFQTITLAITVEAADLSTVTFSYDELTGTAGVEAKSSLPRWTRVKPLFAIYSITDRPVGATVGNVVIVASSEDDAAGEVTITTEATSLDSGDYTVTVTIGTLDPVYVKDSTQTATITVTVNKANQITAAFSYANLGSKAGVAATSTTPTWSGGTTPTDISYSITERPANATTSNVTFNSSTGVITITTGATSTDNGDYTVTATVGSNDPVYAKDVAQTSTIKIEVGDFLVSFDVDGGDGSVPDQAVVNGAFATDPSGNLPTKTGYVLTGWAEQRGGATGFNFESTAITGAITLFAQWTAGEYEVTLDGNDDAAGTPSIVTATFGQAMPTQGLSAITSLDFIYEDRFGTKASGHYIFMGYFANADGSGDQYYDDSMNAITAWNQGAAATIYAKWKKPKYTVTFDYRNGTAVQGGPTEVKVALGDPMPTSPNLLAPFPNDNSLVFTGFTYQSNKDVIGGGSPIDMYYTAAGEGLPLKSGSYLFWNIGGDGTVYAIYGPLGYEKRVNVYSHHDPSSLLTFVVMQSDGFSSAVSETRLGYTSAGDVYQKQDGTGIHTNSASWDWSRNDGVGFVKWIPKTYTVTLDSGGNGGSSTVNATYDAVMLAGRTAPAQAGMKFAGYFTEINGGGTQYYTHDMVSANIWKEDEDSPTIYAKWIASTDIIVSFQYDLVGEVIETVSGASGATLTVPTATRAGYTFTDWDTAPPSTIPNADTRYQAQWTAKAYTITLTPNGGSSGDQAVNATMGARLSNNGLTQPARTGYTFKGYGRYSDGSGTKYFDDSMTAQANWDQVGDTTIYAEWLAKQTTVTLDDGGGNTQTLTATYDNQLPNAGLTVPVRAGYVFEGYYAGADGVGSQYFNKYFDKIDQWDQDVANATIYPKWSQ